ncbi:MAG TPA: YgjP-like metallopeptidase domain-containing protein, partial [Candidatus Eremiobacteraceae bacterium]|nr:YgjP-like metallopeptidase domain-containing protein [Candidatus Eremiobacteraceae bacterium]
LLSRLYRRRAPKALLQQYLDYARADRTRERVSKMRRSRVRLKHTAPQGEHFDLVKLFEQLNAKYFAGTLRQPNIGWSARSWKRQFGCYDPGPNQILLNRRMDREGVPPVVVEYVLYHEMLHVKHPTRRSGCSLISHSREFREEEKRFAEFERARKMLDQLAVSRR